MTTAAPLLPKRPQTTEDLARLIAEAGDKQIQLVGSGSLPLTRLDPARPVQPVSTLRLNKLIEHAVSDMTVIAHAGMTLDALQQQLAWHDQWLPVDPPAVNGRSPAQRTLGGLIATNSLGPLRFGMGDWRMLMLGMRWVDATGTPIKGGGRTVKNAAGYNTPRLMIGACGSLGAIAEVTLRTYARPADERCLVIYCRATQQAEEVLAAILASQVQPAYVQAIGGQGFQTNILQLPAGRMMLVVGFLGRPGVCAAQVELLRALPQVAGLETISQTAAQAGRLRLWMTAEPAASLAFRLHTLSSNIAPAIKQIEALASEHNTRAWLVAEAGSGVLRGALPDIDPSVLFPRLQDLGAPLSATLLPTHGIAAPATPTSALYGRLKSELDPRGVFGHPPILA